jgi:hypothetical protein
VKDAGALPVLHRTLKGTKKNRKNKKSKKKADVCDGDGDMDVNNALMSIMQMESMDEMEDEAYTMAILKPAVNAVREIMEGLENGSTSETLDTDIVSSMMTNFTDSARRNLQELEATPSGERNLLYQNLRGQNGLSDFQQASWGMAYYSFCIVLILTGYMPAGSLTDVNRRGKYFDFAEVVADYVTESGVSASFFSGSNTIASTQSDVSTAVYEQFESIFYILGIGKQLELARHQDALGPLASNSEISTLCGRIIALKNMGTVYTRDAIKDTSDIILADTRDKFATNMCQKYPGSCSVCPLFKDSQCAGEAVDQTCACVPPRSTKYNAKAYSPDGNDCFSCVLPDYSSVECTSSLDCDFDVSKCSGVKADYNGPNAPLDILQTMCIPKSGAANGKPCYTSSLCASNTCVYVGGDSRKGECQ